MLPETGVLAKYRYRFYPVMKTPLFLHRRRNPLTTAFCQRALIRFGSGVGTSLRFELALATDNSCTLPFPHVSPHSYTNIHTAFECITHTYHDGRKLFQGKGESIRGIRGEKKPRGSREPAALLLLLHRWSRASRSVCDGDHGACERTRMDVEARRGGRGQDAHTGPIMRAGFSVRTLCYNQVGCLARIFSASRPIEPQTPLGTTRGWSVTLRVSQRLRGVSAPCSRNLFTRSRLHCVLRGMISLLHSFC